eukprot:SAG31_NODE_212_length_20157_cov_9.648868_17_plen_572_part_00
MCTYYNVYVSTLVAGSLIITRGALPDKVASLLANEPAPCRTDRTRGAPACSAMSLCGWLVAGLICPAAVALSSAQPPDPDPDPEFEQLQAARFQLQADGRPTETPFPSLPLSRVAGAQLHPAAGYRGCGGGDVWLLSTKGELQLLLPTGQLQPTKISAEPGDARGVLDAGSVLASGHKTGALVVAGRKLISWLHCSCVPLACTVNATADAPSSQIASAASTEDARELWLGTAEGLYHLALTDQRNAPPTRVPGISGAVRSVTASADGSLVAASTVETVFWLDRTQSSKAWQHIGVGGVIDSEVTALGLFTALTDAGRAQFNAVAIGTQTALHVLGPDGRVRRISGLQGLPWNNITTFAFGRDDSDGGVGSLWLGTTMGVVRLLNPQASLDDTTPLEWRYYYGPRWLVGDTVTALSRHGRASWAVTEAGTTYFNATPMTLLKKAEHYQQLMDSSLRHNRYGLVASVPLAKYGTAGSAVPTDGDNDGSSTAYYMASQIFRCACFFSCTPVLRTTPGAKFRIVVSCQTPLTARFRLLHSCMNVVHIHSEHCWKSGGALQKTRPRDATPGIIFVQ